MEVSFFFISLGKGKGCFYLVRGKGRGYDLNEGNVFNWGNCEFNKKIPEKAGLNEITNK